MQQMPNQHQKQQQKPAQGQPGQKHAQPTSQPGQKPAQPTSQPGQKQNPQKPSR